MSSAASSLILLFLKSKVISVTVLCKALAILIAPADCKLLLANKTSLSLGLQDKTFLISSAASSLILLPLKSNQIRVTVFCKAFAILIAPADCKPFPPK